MSDPASPPTADHVIPSRARLRPAWLLALAVLGPNVLRDDIDVVIITEPPL